MPRVVYQEVRGLQAGDLLIEQLPPDDEEVFLDLSAVGFVDPAGMVSIATACVEAIALRNRIRVVPPADANVANYLLRMRFRDVLRRHGVHFSGPFATRTVGERPLPGRLIELHDISSVNVVELGARLVNLGRVAGIPDELMARAFVGWDETVENALVHSGQAHAFAVAQRYQERSGAVRVEVAVGDAGFGILQTLQRRRRRLGSHAEALRLAVRTGASRLVNPRRGHGLPFAVGRISSSGRFEIRSGDASLRVLGSYEPSIVNYATVRDGVQVSMVLRAALRG